MNQKIIKTTERRTPTPRRNWEIEELNRLFKAVREADEAAQYIEEKEHYAKFRGSQARAGA